MLGTSLNQSEINRHGSVAHLTPIDSGHRVRVRARPNIIKRAANYDSEVRDNVLDLAVETGAEEMYRRTKLQLDLTQVERERDAARERFNDLRTLVDTLVNRLAVLGDKNDAERKAEAIEVRNLAASIQEEAAKQRQVLAQLKNRTDRYAPLMADVGSMKQELGNMRGHMEAMRKDGEAIALTSRKQIGALAKVVSESREELGSYQKALDKVSGDVKALVTVIEGEMGLVKLHHNMRRVKMDVADNRFRIDSLEKELAELKEAMTKNAGQFDGFSKALAHLRDEVAGLRTRIGRYILDQMRFARKA